MTLEEFSNLDILEKLEVVNATAVEIDERFTMFGDVKLVRCFAIDKFFVEVYHNLYTKEILEITPFVDGDSLHHYTYFMTRYLFNDNPFDNF